MHVLGGFDTDRRDVPFILHLEGFEFGFDGFDHFWIEAALHLDSFDSSLC